MLFVAKLDRGDDQLALAFDIGLVRAVDHDVADVGVGEQLFERTEAEQLVDEHFFERALFAAIERDAQFGEHFEDDRAEFLGQLDRQSVGEGKRGAVRCRSEWAPVDYKKIKNKK